MRLSIIPPLVAIAATTEALVALAAAPVVELGYASYQGVHNATSR